MLSLLFFQIIYFLFFFSYLKTLPNSDKLPQFPVSNHLVPYFIFFHFIFIFSVDLFYFFAFKTKLNLSLKVAKWFLFLVFSCVGIVKRLIMKLKKLYRNIYFLYFYYHHYVVFRKKFPNNKNCNKKETLNFEKSKKIHKRFFFVHLLKKYFKLYIF